MVGALTHSSPRQKWCAVFTVSNKSMVSTRLSLALSMPVTDSPPIQRSALQPRHTVQRTRVQSDDFVSLELRVRLRRVFQLGRRRRQQLVQPRGHFSAFRGHGATRGTSRQMDDFLAQ